MLKKVKEAIMSFKAGLISKRRFEAVVASYLGLLSHCKGRNIKNKIHVMLSSTMSAKLLNGRVARDALKKGLIEKIAELKSRGIAPTLVIIQVGDKPDTASYIKAKKSFGAAIGVEVSHVHLKESTSEREVVDEIWKLDKDQSIRGIILQLPLPEGLKAHTKEIIDSINIAKDADAITSRRTAEWQASGTTGTGPSGKILWPATARGVGELMDFYDIKISGKKICVIGRSALVGTPVAALCRAKGGIVTVCHSKTEDLKKETLSADIIISAVGKIGLITARHVRKGQVVIDIGINEAVGKKLDEELPSRKLVGDVDFEAVAPILGDSGAITPVPGGVGPMTVLALFENLIDLCDII